MHIRELTDPVAIDCALQGRDVPPAAAIPPLPPPIDPSHPRSVHSVIRGRADAPPILSWPDQAGAPDYIVEFSIDHFLNVEHSTDWHGERIATNSYQPAADLWAMAPANRTLFWRVKTRGHSTVITEGAIAPVRP
jgi:hypothetical protein